ncbi:lipopolysaccharide heptosyltransferase II [Patescibacteria group bacterium]
MPTKEYKKILILQPDHIGDVLLATPMVRAIRQRFPEAKIDIVVGSWAKDIVEHNPDIDNIYVFNFRQFNRGRVSNLEKWPNFIKIRSNHYDLAVMARSRNRLIRFFARTAGIPARIGFEVPGKDANLTIKVKQADLKEHVILRNLRIAEALGADISKPELVLIPSQAAEKKAQDILQDRLRPFIGVNPAAGTEAKQWPAERFNDTTRRLSEKYGGTIFVVGGPRDVNLAKEVAKNVPGEVVILAGKTSLTELAALTAKFDLCISNDSGPMHIAATMKCPVIDLHSGTDYPSMWRPWGNEHTVLTHAEDCDKLPCFKTECDYFDHGCLELITVKDVIEAADKYLG